MDYEEIFSPVARMDIVWLLLALAAQKDWHVFHLDVKLAFLNRDINEKVYVEQPKGFEIPGKEHLVYMLHKALEGLKQAPRAWYSRIDAYLQLQGFQRSSSKHALYKKKIIYYWFAYKLMI